MDKRKITRDHFENLKNKEDIQKNFNLRTSQIDNLESNIIDGFNSLINFINGKVSRTEVINQLDTIKTPDVDKVVRAIDNMDKNLSDKKSDYSPIIEAINNIKEELEKLPKEFPTFEQQDNIKVSNLNEIDFSNLENAIKNIKFTSEPIVKVDAPIINVEKTDLKPLKDELLNVVKYLKDIKTYETVKISNLIDIKPTDTKIIEKKLDTGNKYLKEISEKRFGGGGGGGNGSPYVNSTGTIKNVVLDSNGSIPVYQPDVLSINAHTGSKELRVFSEGHVCVDNSTSTPLGINGIFTGDWQDTLDYSEIIVSVFTDEDSAIDGLKVQWSFDGINVHGDDVFTINANNGKTFSFPCQNRYVKVIYTNGSVAQTIISLETLLKRFASKGSSHRIKDSIVGDDDAILAKSIITGLRDDGIFGNSILDNENRLIVSSQPYTYGIAESSIAGHTPVLKFGTRTSILAGVQSTIWEGPTDRYQYLTSAEKLRVLSSNINDTVGGTGLRTITLYGLDANLSEISEVVNMNGTTPVITTNNFLRIYSATSTTVGTSGGSNLGNITITNNAGTITLAYIPINDGQTLMTLSTIPSGKVGYITQLTASNDSNKGARFSLYTRQLDGGISYPWVIKYRAYLVGGNNTVPLSIPFKIPEKTDIEIRFTTPGSAGVTSGGATYELWYENI